MRAAAAAAAACPFGPGRRDKKAPAQWPPLAHASQQRRVCYPQRLDPLLLGLYGRRVGGRHACELVEALDVRVVVLFATLARRDVGRHMPICKADLELGVQALDEQVHALQAVVVLVFGSACDAKGCREQERVRSSWFEG